MKNIIGSIIIILLGLFIIGCSNSEEKLPKTSDKLLYISIYKYSSDGNKSVGINDTIIFKPNEKPEAVKDILKIFEDKEPIKNEYMENPQYRIIFLYNLDPEQSKVREKFLESDKFELVVNKEDLLIRNEETKEIFKIQGDNYDKLNVYLNYLTIP